MRRFDWATGRILILVVFLLAPLAASAQTDTSNWGETRVRDLQQSNTERRQEIAALRREIQDAEKAMAEAEEYLAKKYGVVPADAAAVFYEVKLTAKRTIEKSERVLRKLNRKAASAEALLEALPQIEPMEGEAVSLEHWGDVNIRKAGSAAIQMLKDATPFRLAPGDVIEVGEGGRATFLYPEAAGELMLGSRTRAAIEAIGNSKDPSVKLWEGKIRFWLGRSSAYLNRFFGSNRFTLRTNRMCICKVRGTSFSVEVTGDGGSEIWVFEGEITIISEGSTEEIILTSGQALTVHADGTVEGARTFQTTEIDAWWDKEPSG